jgi:hypothetical protein
MTVPQADVVAEVKLGRGGQPTVELTTNATALWVVLTTRASGRFAEGAFLLEKTAANQPREVAFELWGGTTTDAVRERWLLWLLLRRCACDWPAAAGHVATHGASSASVSGRRWRSCRRACGWSTWRRCSCHPALLRLRLPRLCHAPLLAAPVVACRHATGRTRITPAHLPACLSRAAC